SSGYNQRARECRRTTSKSMSGSKGKLQVFSVYQLRTNAGRKGLVCQPYRSGSLSSAPDRHSSREQACWSKLAPGWERQPLYYLRLAMRYVPLILKNCWRNRRRTILTIASIGVSMCLMGVLIAMYHAFYLGSPAPDQAMRLVVRNRVSITQPLPRSYRDELLHIPGVQYVMMANWFQGVYKD